MRGARRACGCLARPAHVSAPGLVAAALQDSVGPSAASYHWNDRSFALPTDAAGQVMSWRPDLVQGHPPGTFDGLLAWIERARAAGRHAVVPACPTDAICLLLSYMANLGRPLDDAARSFDRHAGVEALGTVRRLVALSVPQSLDWNPVQAYRAMSSGDDLALCPAAFGYSNYARTGQPRPLAFAPLAGPGPVPTAGALLGGAGIAVTSAAEDPGAAIAYLRFVHAPAHQAGGYFAAGGQPGSRAAWLSGTLERDCPGFFRSTLPGLDQACVRARFDGMVEWLEAAGRGVNRCLRGHDGPAETIAALAGSFDDALGETA